MGNSVRIIDEFNVNCVIINNVWINGWLLKLILIKFMINCVNINNYEINS